MNSKKSLNNLIKKMLFMLMIIFIYVLGTHIPLPFAEATERYRMILEHTPMTIIGVMSGADLNSLSVFSIGFNPFMIAMLVLQLLMMIRFMGIDALPINQIQVIQQIIILILTVIQSTLFTLNIVKTDDIWKKISMILILTAGSLLVTWMCFMNIKHGIGGTSPIILINIISGLIPTLSQLIKNLKNLPYPNLWIILIIILALGTAYFWVAFSHAYYPLKTINTSLPSYAKPVIVPIGLNIGAMMTYMVGMAVLSITAMLAPYFSADSLLNNNYFKAGLSFLLAFVLFYFFTFMQFSPKEQAKQLRNSNNYVLNIRPGKPTQRYLRRLVWIVAFPGAFLTAFQLALGLSGYQLLGNYAGIAVIPMDVVMMCMFTLGIKDQIATLLYPYHYDRLKKKEG